MSTVDTYRYYSDSPGTLLSGDEWEKLNESHNPDPNVSLPEGWPQKLEGPLVWTAEELHKDPESYLYILSESDLKEIDVAIKNYDSPLDKVNKDTFSLPTLGPKLEEFSYKLYFGNGVHIIRGFPRSKYDERQSAIAFLGVSSYIGDLRDAQGLNRALTHIKSIAHIPRSERAPIGVSQQTTDPQMFHNDFGGDVVSLFVNEVPKQGGESLVTSGYTVYNELAAKRPDLLNVLAKPNAFKFRGSPEDGSSLIHYVDGRFFTQFSTRYFIGFGELERDTSIPELTEEQKDAFGAYHWIGFQNALVHKLQKGDIEYVNNLFLQHSRLGYEEDITQGRHVSRLWLRNSKYSAQIKKPKVTQDKYDAFFPEKYEQKIPLNEIEEDAIKLEAGADSLDKVYSKPK
ncbi:hypothetical protein BN7_4425 [Wickerhamomyces ciferrii]|uniref:TauD/TfdA-like domain-containing protein n=1 Tax=Wickerhamomyces ciferrii (strain ATCC 14091 / BCRC 22168 / CBS 111 / JCM 3599 / NBRC 0793 / NRRL Y-1031 F-60-10) TaxID=1206466 RepID=K0KPG1_WICCF|nr:uncharacterized protein BN7_4425 [Wickerhamomyces ciferrii]CCH44856.1 hypothetical protein BN7_4425 [Wickerhamomyces ciferrii]